MSSIVSRRPPPSVSTNQSNDRFWMSIRLGTSSTFSRRANVRRVRGASTEAKTATPLGEVRANRRRGARPSPLPGQSASPRGMRAREAAGRGARKARPAKIAQGRSGPPWGRVGAHGPRPARTPYVAERAQWTAAAIGRRKSVYRSAQGLVWALGAAHREPTGFREHARGVQDVSACEDRQDAE